MARAPKQTAPPPTPEPQQTSPSSTTYPTGSQGNASMTSFSDILDTPMDSIEAPKVTPAGQYVAVVDGNYETGESRNQKTPYVRVKFKLLQGMEDVNPEELAEAKAIGRTAQTDFYLTENSLFRLKEFLLNVLGIEAKGLKEALSQIPGRQFIAVCSHELTNPTDGSEPRVLARFNRFLKV